MKIVLLLIWIFALILTLFAFSQGHIWVGFFCLACTVYDFILSVMTLRL